MCELVVLVERHVLVRTGVGQAPAELNVLEKAGRTKTSGNVPRCEPSGVQPGQEVREFRRSVIAESANFSDERRQSFKPIDVSLAYQARATGLEPATTGSTV